MGQAVAYGSISIIDMTDLGQFSIQPTSNRPLSVIYDPDANTYTPNWGTQNLIITPITYYGGTEILPSDSALSTSWTRQINGGTETELTTGETVSSNVLTVSSNKLSGDVTLITYRVTAIYTEPTAHQQLTAKGQITFSLVKNAARTKNCKISGDSIIKIKADGSAYLGYESVVLHADFTGVSLQQNSHGWQYQRTVGTSTIWADYPSSSVNNQNGDLTVDMDDTDSNYSNTSVFTNDKCVIRFITNNNDVYDIHTVTILRDGPAGNNVVSAVLTNEDQMIPVSSNGTGDYSSAVTQIMIYEGGVNVTELWTISRSGSTGVTLSSAQEFTTSSGTHASTNDIVKVTDMTNDTGNVTFTCTRTNYNTITKVFSLIKVRSGADGTSPTIYSLEPDAYAVNKSINGVYSPGTITFRAYSQTGSAAKQPYQGRYEVYLNVTYSDFKTARGTSSQLTPAFTSGQQQNYDNYVATLSTIAASSALSQGSSTIPLTSILVVLYKGGGFSDILDAQSVIITNDGETGATGAQGPAGQDSINLIFSNYSDVLNCDSSNKLLANMTITIPFKAFKGTTQVACSGPTNTTIKFTNLKRNSVSTPITPTVSNATANTDGTITWALLAGDEITAVSGAIQITFTVEGQTVKQYYTWTRTTAATNGENAVLFQIFAPNGNYVTQSINSVLLEASLMDGATEQISNATKQWYKYTNGQYTSLSGQTGSTLTVQNSMVDSYASFKCTASYSNKTYTAYYSVFDKTDPIQVSVFSSFGEQIMNGQGVGALYVRVTRLGQEIDELYSDRFLESQPTGSATAGDFYYLLNKTQKTLTLKKYSGSAWANATETYAGEYKWTWRDKNGDPLPKSGNYQYITIGTTDIQLPSEGKVVYIDGSMIDTKIIADVEVTI